MSLRHTQLLPDVISAIVYLRDARGSIEKDIFGVIKDNHRQFYAEKEVLRRTLKYGVDLDVLEYKKPRYKLGNCYAALACLYRRSPRVRTALKETDHKPDTKKPLFRCPATSRRRNFLDDGGRKYVEDSSQTREESDDENWSDSDDESFIL